MSEPRTSKPVYCPRRRQHDSECETPDACAGGINCRLGPDDVQLAGNYMALTEDDAGNATITFSDDKPSGRVCGSCSLCCKLLPIPPLDKPAGVRCQHMKHGKGCMIYAARPAACRTWACRWLIDQSTAGLPRPDRAHYVIDLSPDYIIARKNDGSGERKVPVIQVWIDPAFPDAHRAPELRAWLARQAERFRCAALIRYDNQRAITLAPPSMNDTGKWVEFPETMLRQTEHTADQVAEAMAEHAARLGR